MRQVLPIVGFGLVVLTGAPRLLAQSDRAHATVLPGDLKAKTKGGTTVVRDKSKPVRKALEDWYDRNMAAFAAKDVTAIMALRTDDFHTITPDGKVTTRADMAVRTKGFLDRIDHFVSQDNQIGTIELEDSLASADVTQRLARIQRFPNGTLHKVETSVVQRETWKRTGEGWKLFRVDQIRDGPILVDGKRYQPNQ